MCVCVCVCVCEYTGGAKKCIHILRKEKTVFVYTFFGNLYIFIYIYIYIYIYILLLKMDLRRWETCRGYK